VLVVGLLLTWRAGWGLSIRRISFPRLAGLVLAAQAGLHLAFVLSAAGSRQMPAMSGARGTMAGQRLDLLPGGPAMALLHLGAALCLAWWLAAGERLLWRAARGVATVARRTVNRLRPLRPLVVPTAVPMSRGPAIDLAVSLCVLRHALIRRGPPAWS
jgi:hypothetical protein